MHGTKPVHLQMEDDVHIRGRGRQRGRGGIFEEGVDNMDVEVVGDEGEGVGRAWRGVDFVRIF